jgi:hypothetical protein
MFFVVVNFCTARQKSVQNKRFDPDFGWIALNYLAKIFCTPCKEFGKFAIAPTTGNCHRYHTK